MSKVSIVHNVQGQCCVSLGIMFMIYINSPNIRRSKTDFGSSANLLATLKQAVGIGLTKVNSRNM